MRSLGPGPYCAISVDMKVAVGHLLYLPSLEFSIEINLTNIDELH